MRQRKAHIHLYSETKNTSDNKDSKSLKKKEKKNKIQSQKSRCQIINY